MSSRSQLQHQVVNLYKEMLRASRNKPGIEAHVKAEFRRNASEISKKDIRIIEYHLQRGLHQLHMLKTTSVTGMNLFRNETKN